METKIPVRDVMTRTVVTVDIKTDISTVARKMVEYDVGSVIITERGYPVGIVTEKDLVKKVLSRNVVPSSLHLKSIMTSPLITIPSGEDTQDAIKKMLRMGVRRLPVVEGGRLVGIVTDLDLVAISSELGGILADIIEMHRTRNVLEAHVSSISQGICENCSQFSENLVNVNGTLLCESCRET